MPAEHASPENEQTQRAPAPTGWVWDDTHPCWLETIGGRAWARVDPDTGSFATGHLAIPPAALRALVAEAERMGLPGWERPALPEPEPEPARGMGHTIAPLMVLTEPERRALESAAQVFLAGCPQHGLRWVAGCDGCRADVAACERMFG